MTTEAPVPRLYAMTSGDLAWTPIVQRNMRLVDGGKMPGVSFVQSQVRMEETACPLCSCIHVSLGVFSEMRSSPV